MFFKILKNIFIAVLDDDKKQLFNYINIKYKIYNITTDYIIYLFIKSSLLWCTVSYYL